MVEGIEGMVVVEGEVVAMNFQVVGVKKALAAVANLPSG